MAITHPTANLFHDTRRQLNGTEKYPVKLNIYYLASRKRYKLPYNLTKDEWLKINSPKLRDIELKNIKTKLDFYIGNKFEECLKKIDEPFTFEKFEKFYFEKNKPIPKCLDVYSTYQSLIDKMELEGNVGNAKIHKCALKTFKKLKKRLNFSDVTIEFLKDYEKLMAADGLSTAYIAMNLRTLRSVYNHAISSGSISNENYPFSRKMNDKKFKIKVGANTKKALTTHQLKQFKNHVASSPAQQKALDFWMLSFYCNGMNFKDIGRLKYKDTSNNKIEFIRAKTKNSTNSSQTIRFDITPEIQEFLNKYANPKISNETYLFNILKEDISPKQEMVMIQSFTRNLRKHLKKVCKDLKFDFNVSACWARHSFATYLKRSGVTTEVIGEALGHTSITTTRNYLDSFDDEALAKTAKLLSEI